MRHTTQPKAVHAGLRAPRPKPLGPLSEEDRQRVRAVLDRLAAELRLVLTRFGPDARSARGLAGRLGLDVAVCQRVLAGASESGPDSQRLQQLPGCDGVGNFINAAIVGAGARSARGAAAALTQYRALIQDLGGSHANLVRRLRATEVAADPSTLDGAERVLRARRDVLRGISEVLGYSSDLATFIGVLRPTPERSDLIEGASVRGFHGLRTQGRRVCLTTQATQLRRDASDLAAEVRWSPLGDATGGAEGLVTEFSTKPAPMTSLVSEDGVLRQVIDPAQVPPGSPVDVVLGRRYTGDLNPQHTPDRTWSQILRCRHPSERMVFDTFIHRSMIGRAVPAVGAYYWHPTLPSDPRANWQDRLPGSPRTEIIPGPLDAGSTAWSGHGALVAWLFRALGWPADEFVGFRCDERYPIWGAAYYITFDLSPAAG